MARNAEKAMTTLARWRAAQVQESGGQRERRPFIAAECNDLPRAEKWRLEIVREIAKKVAQIQNEMEEADTEDVQPSSSKEPSVMEPMLEPEPPGRAASIVASPSPIFKSPQRLSSPTKSTNSERGSNRSSKNSKPEQIGHDLVEKVSNLEPKSLNISVHLDELTDTVKKLSEGIEGPHSPAVISNVDKIATMSQVLTNEAKALRQSIKSLAEDIVRTKKELCQCGPVIDQEDVSFPYHLFLIELIVNKIHMKCECFDFDYNNLIISASFLGKQPIILYDATYGKVESFTKLNVGKSTLFAMTYDKICSIKEFEIVIELTKHPPCSSCITRIGETHLDYTNEFIELREELCKKWMQEQPKDNILCTTSTPLSKNMYYLSCGDIEHQDTIGIIEVTVRMSFLGKEITTAFTANPKPQGTTCLHQEDNGMTMYSSTKVEMDDTGKVLLNEDSLTKKPAPCYSRTLPTRGSDSPRSQLSIMSSKRAYGPVQYSYNNYQAAGLGEFRIRDLNDEINKLMREKRHWEVQIKALGGPDHARVGPRMLDQDGKEVPGNRGYKYFGAAKDLPGVRELFEQEPPPPPRRTRADLMRDVDADYYGYRDDDDGLLLPLEQEAQRIAIARAVEEWKKNKEQNKDQDLPEEENIYPEDPEDKRIDDDEPVASTMTSHVAVPSQKDIEEALLRRKKQELLEKYGCLDVKMEGS